MIWFTSDIHFGHQNIIRLCNRPFSSVSEMNAALLRDYNARVHTDDVCYILGDLAFKLSVDEVNSLIKRMNGRKVLIRGNHDKQYDSSLFEEICDFKELTLDGHKVSLMHYPLAEWPGFYHGAVHLHGHQHNDVDYNIEQRSSGLLRYDVGVDANGYAPVSWSEVKLFLGLVK